VLHGPRADGEPPSLIVDAVTTRASGHAERLAAIGLIYRAQIVCGRHFSLALVSDRDSGLCQPNPKQSSYRR
jgi:hypothetical protein